jgi:uncharacterized protein
MSAASTWGPVQPEERIALIDVLRGLALFGIIAANMRGFAGPHLTYFAPDLLWKTRLDFWVQAFVDTFIQGKFITLFAFLFGVGFSLQFSRAEARGSRFGPIYRRRLEALIFLGVLHQVLFWWGDILVSYGLGGFLLMAFRKRTNKTVAIWLLSLMMVPTVGTLSYQVFRLIKPQTQQQLATAKIRSERNKLEKRLELNRIVGAYQEGNYFQVMRERLKEDTEEIVTQPGVVIYTLPIFLMGLLVFRRGIFQDPEANRTLLKKGLIFGLLIGIPANVADTWVQHLINAQTPTGGPGPLMVVLVTLRIFGRPLLSMGYACAIALVFMNVTWRARILPFGAIGRTALSNYLLQTIVGTTIFYGYGGGLFGRVNLAWLFVLSLVIYGLQVPLSRWWLSRYRFGPAEWLWRTMTYGKPPSMQREVLAATAS